VTYATVIGVGNDWRGDDAAGLIAARRLRATLTGVRVLEVDGDPAALLDAWTGAHHTIVIDAVRSGAEPGAIHRLDLTAGAMPARLQRGSTHGLGVAEAVELARALDRLPTRLELYGVEAVGFETAAGLTPAIARAVEALCGELRERLAGAPRPR
jgi:hydrogenase maturation protease